MNRRPCLLILITLVGCASSSGRWTTVPTVPPNYAWADNFDRYVTPHFPDLTNEPIRTLDAALAPDRLPRIQSRTAHLFQTGGGGSIEIAPGQTVYESTLRLAVLPLVHQGPAAGPTLLPGLRSDKRYVRLTASEALQAAYHLDVPFCDQCPPDSPESANAYRIWAAIVRCGSPSTSPVRP